MINNWQKILINSNVSIKKSMEIIDEESLRMALVVDENNCLLGSVTDGDVRRGLLMGIGLENSVSDIMNSNPFYIFEDDISKAKGLMRKHDLLGLPILNDKRQIIGFESYNYKNSSTKTTPVFLMAGGFGKRLGSLTADTPKPMLKIGDTPILEKIIRQFAEIGFVNFYISTHFKAEKVRDHFGDGSSLGINIRYIHEDEPLGTAGALGLLDEIDEPFIMMNGDLLTKVNFDKLIRFHGENDSKLTTCVREYEIQIPYGVIVSEQYKVKSIEEKPTHKFNVNAGIYVIDPSIVASVEKGKYLDMPSLIEKTIEKGDMVTMFPIHEYWIDVGLPEELSRAQEDWK